MATTEDRKGSASGLPQPGSEELIHILSEIAEKSQTLLHEFAQRQQRAQAPAPSPVKNPAHITQAFMELTQRMMANPAALMQAQFSLWQDYVRLWHVTTQRMLGQETTPVVTAPKGDRRFRDPAWEENALFDFIKQSYLLTSKWIMDAVHDAEEGLDRQTREKIEFYTRQYVDAMAPSNFVMTNPEVLRSTIETRGENLIRGLKNMLEDIERGGGQLQIRQTDTEHFELGKNVATAPGKVVFQTDLMQLIQYSPTTEQVYERPLLIMPPWINKFYILDLQPKNSFIRYAVDQGFTVFVCSWINPDERYADKSFEDYIKEGPLAALDAMKKATGCDDALVIGYCIGGTLLSMTLAHLAKKGRQPVKAATFFTTMLDFTEPGELGVFIDEEQLAAIEESMAKTGYLDGAEMAGTFSMMRANDLIWSFVVNNYMLGKDPFPFDLLYWNSDSTRMPRAMHSYYLRQCYQHNKLVEPNGLTLLGTPLDLSEITVPACFISAKEDHIAPWKSTYRGFKKLGGPKEFILSGSGHIAGIINPPTAKKYCYWTNHGKPFDTAEEWFAEAERVEGSWWPRWAEWLKPHAGDLVPARTPGKGKLKAIEDAPGSYVKARSVDRD